MDGWLRFLSFFFYFSSRFSRKESSFDDFLERAQVSLLRNLREIETTGRYLKLDTSVLNFFAKLKFDWEDLVQSSGKV